MKQIKVILSPTSKALEDHVNAFCSDMNDRAQLKYDIVDIKYQINNDTCSAMIIYEQIRR